MYLMSRKIKAMGIKMVLSGEGADEVFGGYLYFHKAPDAKEFHEETVRKLLALNMFDCARANKAMAAWGVEARVPFLDKEFLEVAMRVNPKDKMCGNGKIEKHIIRECFEDYLHNLSHGARKSSFQMAWVIAGLTHSKLSPRKSQRPTTGNGELPLPIQYADNQGSVYVSRNL